MKIIFDKSLQKQHRQNIRFMLKTGKTHLKTDDYDYIVMKGSISKDTYTVQVAIVPSGALPEDIQYTDVNYTL